MADADYGGGLRHTVAGYERKLELLDEQGLEMLRNRRSAGGEHLHVAAYGMLEYDSERIAEVRVVLVVLELGRSALRVDELSESLLDKLGENQGHAEEHMRLVLAQRRLEVRRYRRDDEHHEVHSYAQGSDHVDGHSEYVRVGEHAHVVLSPPERNMDGEEVYVHAEVPVGKHHALGVTGRARGIHDRRRVVELYGREADVACGISGRVGFIEERVRSGMIFLEAVPGSQELVRPGVDRSQQPRHLLEVHFLEDRLLGVQYARVGMVDEVRGVVRRERVEYLDGDEASGLSREEELRPFGAALGVDRYLVTSLEPCGLPDEVEFLYFSCQLSVSEDRPLVVVECRLVPAVSDGLFELQNEVVGRFDIVHLDRINISAQIYFFKVSLHKITSPFVAK